MNTRHRNTRDREIDSCNLQRPMSIRRVVALIALGALISGCRFKVPNIGEGQEFARRGSFPEGAPNWVKVPPEMGVQSAGKAGIVPLSYSTPPVSKTTQSSIPSGEMAPPDPLAKSRAMLEARAAQGAESASRMGGTAQEEQLSPLAKIDKLCPGLEKGVNEALTTTEVTSRIRKYESLTTRCPESADLWIWLGKDYASIKKLSEASRCYQRALSAEPSNSEAKSLLQGLEGQSSSLPPAPNSSQRTRLINEQF